VADPQDPGWGRSLEPADAAVLANAAAGRRVGGRVHAWQPDQRAERLEREAGSHLARDERAPLEPAREGGLLVGAACTAAASVCMRQDGATNSPGGGDAKPRIGTGRG
jgi:hypothetical protein